MRVYSRKIIFHDYDLWNSRFLEEDVFAGLTIKNKEVVGLDAIIDWLDEAMIDYEMEVYRCTWKVEIDETHALFRTFGLTTMDGRACRAEIRLRRDDMLLYKMRFAG